MEIDQNSLAKCPNCGSIMVCWNWFDNIEFAEGTPGWSPEYYHECWACDSCFDTKEEVTNGVPYEALRILRVLHDAGLPVVYTEAMDLLYNPKRVNKD